MTGGIVPCPGALFVMMMALASGAAAFGLYLITVFSVGLALTLMTVGIVMVKGRGMVDRFAPNSNLIQVLPVVSSLIIMFVGAGFMLNGLMKHGILTINL
jgi:ABC-type nickel/cobalt efflux system permease component RcnA